MEKFRWNNEGLVGLILGFLIELVIIIPLFYLITGGLATISIPTLNSTWIYHSLLILGTSYAIYKSKDIPKAVNRYFGQVLFWVFIALTFALLGITIGCGFYSNNLKMTIEQFPLFTFSLTVYLALGAIFCIVFPKLTSDAYSDQLKQRRLADSFTVKSLKKSRIWSMKSVYLGIGCIFIVSLLAAPIDQAFSIVTPNVGTIKKSNQSDGSITLLLGLSGFTNGSPIIDTNFSKVTWSYYTITPAKIGGTHSVIILSPSYLQNRNLKASSYYGIYSWGDVIAYPDYTNISLDTLPIRYGVNGLNVTYPENTDHPFNVTIVYWENIEVNDVSITSQPAICDKYNGTLYQWIYRFTIENHNPNYLKVEEIQLYGYIMNNENGTAVSVKFNGNNVGGTILDTKISLNWAIVPVGKTIDVEVIFLSPNSLDCKALAVVVEDSVAVTTSIGKKHAFYVYKS